LYIHKLNTQEIELRLQDLNNWTHDAASKSIHHQWEFDSFKTAMNFFVRVGEISEKLNHHPEFLSVYTKVQIRLTTHDAQGLTTKDFDLAIEIDRLLAADFSNLLKRPTAL